MGSPDKLLGSANANAANAFAPMSRNVLLVIALPTEDQSFNPPEITAS